MTMTAVRLSVSSQRSASLKCSRNAKSGRNRMADGFKPVKISLVIDDFDAAEHFMRGLIVAKSNNSSPYFEDLIDSLNSVLEPHRAQALLAEVEKRQQAGMP